MQASVINLFADLTQADSFPSAHRWKLKGNLPAEGGTQEVTRYGMYDDTRDYVSGGKNPPKINDPGEFAALRA